MKQASYKVIWGQFNPRGAGLFTTLHKSEDAAKAKAKKERGTVFVHNPFSSRVDHTDAFGVWEIYGIKK